MPLDRNHAFKDEYYFLSNMFQVPIVYKGRVYGSSEAAFQAQKCIREEDRVKFMRIGPYDAKKLGKTMELRADWAEVKEQFMREILAIKFRLPEMRKKLLETGTMELVEYNYWGDTYWGICRGEGENHLGKILMEIRADILAGNQ